MAFELPNLPYAYDALEPIISKKTLEFHHDKHHAAYVNNIVLTSAKGVHIKIELLEKVENIDEVVVKAQQKDKTINEFSVVSARSFSIEETNRYAGSWGDPARMVSNFAGVITAGDQRNDIIIRGNSPSGVVWRLDGVVIPNPNHFGTFGTTGGPISILNNNQLSNSDFFTSAYRLGEWKRNYNG